MQADAGQSGATSVRRGLVWILVGQVALLALTGLALWFTYRPTGAEAWGGGGRGASDGVATLRSLHRLVALTTVGTAATLAAVGVAEAVQRWRGPGQHRIGALAGPATAVLAVAALASGWVLPWDQLALRAVTVGSDVRGYQLLLDGDAVRFVLVDGLEISAGAFRWWLLLHVIVLPVAISGLLVLTQRDRVAPPADARMSS